MASKTVNQVSSRKVFSKNAIRVDPLFEAVRLKLKRIPKRPAKAISGGGFEYDLDADLGQTLETLRRVRHRKETDKLPV